MKLFFIVIASLLLILVIMTWPKYEVFSIDYSKSKYIAVDLQNSNHVAVLMKNEIDVEDSFLYLDTGDGKEKIYPLIKEDSIKRITYKKGDAIIYSLKDRAIAKKPNKLAVVIVPDFFEVKSIHVNTGIKSSIINKLLK